MTPAIAARAGLVAAILALAAPAAGAYECMAAYGVLDPAESRNAERDPKAEIRRLEAALAAPAAAGHNVRARLYAMLANAYQLDDQPGRMQAATAAGLAAIDDPTERGLVDFLATTEAYTWIQLGEPKRALERYEAAAARVAEAARYYPCVLDERAYLRYRNDRIADAVLDFGRAYSLSVTRGFDAERANVANDIASTYLRLGFLDEAVPFANEAIGYFSQSGDERELSDAYRHRANALAARGDYAAARRDGEAALVYARRTRDTFRELYGEVALCAILRGAGDLVGAGRACATADRLAATFEDPEGRQTAAVTSGELALAAGRPEQALARLDAAARALDHEARRDLWGRIDLARAHAYERLGDYRRADEALNAYLQRRDLDEQANRAARIALLRVQFETGLAQQALALATAEKTLLAEKAAREQLLRNAALAAAAFVLAASALYVISRQRRLRADRARHDAEQRLDAVARLTGGVAHDFNNLMTVIQHAVGLVALHPALRGDSPSQRLLEQARESATLGGAITRQLLAFSSQLDLKPEALELPTFFERTRPVFAGALAGRATLEIRLAPSLPRVWVDPALLVTALVNLLVNARDALVGPATIEISARYAGADDPPLPDGRPAVRIDVRDPGAGMAPEVLARAIEPFYSTKGPGRGSGLGLSVVEGFLRQSGGRFALDSSPGAGTTATLWLPIAAAGP